MKMRSIVFAAVAAVAVGTSAKAEVSARVWMLDHAAPNSDELAELRQENPDAYALVKALLTKRSLGLLDPKHPTASFSKPAPTESSDHPVGAAVYEKFATTDKEREALSASAVPYADSEISAVAPPSSGSHDWLNWKPDASASDDAMVKNVLGAVGGLVGGKPAAPEPAQGSVGSLDADEASILSADDSPAKPAPVPVAQEQASAQNFLAKAPVVDDTPAAPAAPAENSYLKGLDLTTDDETPTHAPVAAMAVEATVVDTPAAPVAAMALSGTSALDSFSFSDDNTAQAPAATTAAPKAAAAPKAPSALGSWLGMVKPHVQPAQQPVAEAPKEADSNPYLTDLQ